MTAEANIATITCRWCGASVKGDALDIHIEWHGRLRLAIKNTSCASTVQINSQTRNL